MRMHAFDRCPVPTRTPAWRPSSPSLTRPVPVRFHPTRHLAATPNPPTQPLTQPNANVGAPGQWPKPDSVSPPVGSVGSGGSFTASETVGGSGAAGDVVYLACHLSVRVPCVGVGVGGHWVGACSCRQAALFAPVVSAGPKWTDSLRVRGGRKGGRETGARVFLC